MNSRLLTACVLSLLPLSSSAHVETIIVESVNPAIYGDRSFGNAGRYEYVTGRIRGSVNPDDTRNRIITDLFLAPRNAKGEVEYEATFSLLKPRDMSQASGLLL